MVGLPLTRVFFETVYRGRVSGVSAVSAVPNGVSVKLEQGGGGKKRQVAVKAIACGMVKA